MTDNTNVILRGMLLMGKPDGKEQPLIHSDNGGVFLLKAFALLWFIGQLR